MRRDAGALFRPAPGSPSGEHPRPQEERTYDAARARAHEIGSDMTLTSAHRHVRTETANASCTLCILNTRAMPPKDIALACSQPVPASGIVHAARPEMQNARCDPWEARWRES